MEQAESTAPETTSTETAAPDTSNPSTETATEGQDTTDSGKEAGLNGEGKVVKLPASIKPPQKTGRFQQRISDLVQARKAAEDRARQLEELLAQARTAPKPTPQAKRDGATLNPDDFETYAEYLDALVEQRIEAKRQQNQERVTKESYDTYQAQKREEFNQYCAPLAESYGEGFWDTISDPTLPVSEPMADAIMELGEMGPYTLLWLAGNRTEAAKIFRMNPRQSTIEIGKLALRLEREIQEGGTVAPSQPAQSAPAFTGQNSIKPKPVPTIRGSAPAQTLDGMPSDKDDIQTWLAKESARIRKVNPNARFYGAR